MARVPASELIYQGANPVRTAPGKSVTIYKRGTETLATIYAAETGETTVAQPLLTDAGGLPSHQGSLVWVEAGEYDYKIGTQTYPVTTGGLPDSVENVSTAFEDGVLDSGSERRAADVTNAEAASNWGRLSTVLYGTPTGVYIGASFPSANRLETTLAAEAKSGATTIQLGGGSAPPICGHTHYKIGTEKVLVTTVTGVTAPFTATLAAALKETHSNGATIVTTELDYAFYHGIGGGRYAYWTLPYLTNNPPAYSYGLNQIHNAGTAIPMLSKPRKDASFTRTGTWVNNEPREEAFSGGYYYSKTAADTLKWTSPSCTAVGWRGVTTANGGAVIVSIDGSRTAANLLPTAEALVNAGLYPNTLLVAHGGPASPTDRILSCYSSALNWDAKVALASGLTAKAHEVELIATAIAAEGGTEGRLYYTGMTSTDGTTTPATSEAALIPEYNVTASTFVSSAWERADKEAPTAGGTQTFVGDVHGYEEQDSLTVFKVTNSTSAAVLAAGEIVTGSTLRIVRTSHTYHPDSLEEETATCETTYQLDQLGLLVSDRKTIQKPMTFTEGYVMSPANGMNDPVSPFNRVALSNYPEALTLAGLTDTRYGQSKSAYAISWGSAGKVSLAAYVPDIYGLTDGFTRGLPNFISVEDREGKLTKIYFALVGNADAPWLLKAGEEIKRACRYVISYFSGGAEAVLAPGGGSRASINAESSSLLAALEAKLAVLEAVPKTETLNDASACATMPRASTISVSLTSGSVYGFRAICVKAGIFTKVRCFSHSAGGAEPSKLVAGVWNAAGTVLLAHTADFHSEYALSKKLEVALAESLTLTVGQEVFIGIASVSASAIQLRGSGGLGVVLNTTPIMARSTTGYTTGNPPESCGAAGTGALALMELLP